MDYFLHFLFHFPMMLEFFFIYFLNCITLKFSFGDENDISYVLVPNETNEKQ